MKNITRKIKKDDLQKEIDRNFEWLQHYRQGSEEYDETLKKIERLYDLKKQEEKNHISYDTLAIIAGNIGVTCMILYHEKAHVITTKALGYLLKMRV